MTLILTLAGLLAALGITLAVGAPRPQRQPVRIRAQAGRRRGR